ncbi:hypothetical protein [Pseudorhizobium flavum]|uniref:hypothetical protein n=1 Tax=Pseudorhizobium flavum TaxID=1335061 RepID=UPI00376F7E14
MSTLIAAIVDDLERYAFANEGVFWLPLVDCLDNEPGEPVRLLADFPDGQFSAEVFAEQLFQRVGMRSHTSAISDFSVDDIRSIKSHNVALGKLLGRVQPSRRLSAALQPFNHFLLPTLSYRCSDGWVPIVHQFLEDVHSNLLDGEFFALCSVANRSGTLEISWASTSPEGSPQREQIWKAHARAVFSSHENCEVCGELGAPRSPDNRADFVACGSHSGGAEAVETPDVLMLKDSVLRRREDVYG